MSGRMTNRMLIQDAIRDYHTGKWRGSKKIAVPLDDLDSLLALLAKCFSASPETPVGKILDRQVDD